MSDRDRLMAYAAALIAIFVLAWAAGSLVSGDDDVERHEPAQHG